MYVGIDPPPFLCAPVRLPRKRDVSILKACKINIGRGRVIGKPVSQSPRIGTIHESTTQGQKNLLLDKLFYLG